ncbi:hypothetical protein SAMN05880561_10541 [Rhizobium sp. RU33A]|nr:hypothetical protein SAMN05880561_10541 [Rhizobium sp. RU33A]
MSGRLVMRILVSPHPIGLGRRDHNVGGSDSHKGLGFIGKRKFEKNLAEMHGR